MSLPKCRMMNGVPSGISVHAAREAFTLMRLFFFPFQLAQVSGKDKKMNTPKTPAEFDYDLWTTEDGKCMVRVKRTREVSEVDRGVFRLLRLEEKRIRREIQGVPIPACKDTCASILSLDYISSPDSELLESGWLEAPDRAEDDVIFRIEEDTFEKGLSAVQLEVYTLCIKGGASYKEYAKMRSISPASVSCTLKQIRKKAKKFFYETA